MTNHSTDSEFRDCRESGNTSLCLWENKFMRDSQDSTTFLHRRRRTDVAMSMEITSLHLRFSSGEQVLKKLS